MGAQRAFKSNSASWRPAAYASINTNWKRMFPDADRSERLAWIAEFLGLDQLDSTTDLSDDQLGAVAGQLKYLTGRKAEAAPRPGAVSSPRQTEARGNVVRGEFGGKTDEGVRVPSETVFLASEEMVYTIEKLIAYIGWPAKDISMYLRTRFYSDNPRMMKFSVARNAVNSLLHLAAHRDIKSTRPGEPVSRNEVGEYIPRLKQKLQIDQGE